jgi:hypothetical protein
LWIIQQTQKHLFERLVLFWRRDIAIQLASADVTGEQCNSPVHHYTIIAGPQVLQRFLSHRRAFADAEASCT